MPRSSASKRVKQTLKAGELRLGLLGGEVLVSMGGLSPGHTRA